MSSPLQSLLEGKIVSLPARAYMHALTAARAGL
jgi:hypothetical protein